MKILRLIATIWFFIPILCLCQKAPIKFGSVSMEELKMKKYSLDTSAYAVVLCRYGYFDPVKFQFTTNLRIKILTKEGYSYANQSVHVSDKAFISGKTFNLENGKVVESKLKSESIFKEKLFLDYYQFNFAMPNVKEGSVIDIEYTMQGLPIKWYFQQEIPVKYSELVIYPNKYLSFSKNYFGYEPFSESSEFRWVARDMPAFKSEPYMNSIENYLTKFEFDVHEIGWDRSTSWDNISRNLSRHDYVGELTTGSLFLNSAAKEIKEKYSLPEDKIKAAFEFIKVVKWNEIESLYATYTNLNLIYKAKKGNSADINLMLVNLLKKLDIEAYPIALSSRRNGVISTITPSLHKLNYVIVLAKANEKVYFLDATEEYAPINILPKRALNGNGRMIDYDNKGMEVKIQTDKKDKSLAVYDLKLNEDLKLSGMISYMKSDYAALDFRRNYSKFNSTEEYLQDFLKDKPGINVDSFSIINIDSIYKPIQETYKVSISDQIVDAGDLIYLNPLIFERIKENPFKLLERKYPVDYAYATDNTVVVKFILPEKVIVSELPKPILLKLPDNGASFLFNISSIDNTIQITTRFLINKPIFYSDEYLQLKEMYNQIIKKQVDPIILKRVK